MPRHLDQAATARLVAWTVLAVLAFVQAYAVLHESGHALAAAAAGGNVRTIDARAWSTRPHAAYDLSGVTDGQRAFVTAAGAVLPLAVWATVVAALPRTLPPTLTLVRFFVSIGLLAGLLPWMVLPWPALHAWAPRDDVVRFAQTSGWPAALIAVLALALMLGGFALWWRRAGGLAQLRAFRRMGSLAVPTRTLAVTAAVLLGSVSLALGLVAAFPVRDADAPGVGVALPNHEPIAEVTLDGSPFDGALGHGAAGTAPLRLVLGFEDVAGGPFRILLTDATGSERVLASFGPGTIMGVASSRPRLELPPGPWTLRLIAEDTRGRLRAWIADTDEPPGP
jgi:hypothetical protein